MSVESDPQFMKIRRVDRLWVIGVQECCHLPGIVPGTRFCRSVQIKRGTGMDPHLQVTPSMIMNRNSQMISIPILTFMFYTCDCQCNFQYFVTPALNSSLSFLYLQVIHSKGFDWKPQKKKHSHEPSHSEFLPQN